MLDYLLPAIFLGLGALLLVRATALPAHGSDRILGLFALGAGVFLLALTYMCHP